MKKKKDAHMLQQGDRVAYFFFIRIHVKYLFGNYSGAKCALQNSMSISHLKVVQLSEQLVIISRYTVLSEVLEVVG